MTKPGISLGMPSTKPFYKTRTDRNTAFPQEHVSEQGAAHPDPAVNAPDRQVYPLFIQGLSPSESRRDPRSLVRLLATHHQFAIRFARATMAWTNSLVDAVPPRSPVRTLSSFSV
jgi:hypothetical protein